MKKIKFLFLSVLVLNLIACGEDEVNDVLNVKPQEKTLERMNGVWKSDCVDSEFGEYYGKRIITLKYANNDFEISTEIYYSDDCSLTPDRTTSYKGTYSVQKNLDGNTLLLEYSVPIDVQIWQLLSQKIRLSDSEMLVSEVVSGLDDQNSYELKIPLQKVMD